MVFPTSTTFGIDRLISKNPSYRFRDKKMNNNTPVVVVNVIKVMRWKRQYFTEIFL